MRPFCGAQTGPGQNHGAYLFDSPRQPLAAGDARIEAEGGALDEDSRAWLESGTPRLFDLDADSNENEDVAAEHPDVVDDLKMTLDAWWEPGRPAPGAPRP